MIRLLIVDDEYYVRKGISEAVDWASVGVEIAAEAEDGERGLELALSLHPDLILVDIQMPFMNGLELIEKVKKLDLDCGIIVLSGYDEFSYAQKSIKNGVLDYLLKPIETDVLVKTISAAYAVLQNRRSSKIYQNLLTADSEVIRSQFWRDLLLGLYDESKINDKIQILGFPQNGSVYQIILFRIDDYDLRSVQAAPDELNIQQNKVLKIFLSGISVLSEEGNININKAEISPEEWVCIVYYPAADNGIYEDKLQGYYREFICGLDITIPYTISLYVSGFYTNPKDLTSAYSEARKNNKKLIPGRNSLCFSAAPAAENIRKEVYEAIRYIENHYHENIDVQTVSNRLYISPSYFMHLFKQDLGVTFNTYLTEFRVEVAKEFLREPNCKVYEIAKKVGYSDTKHFNKIFKKYTGMTPSDFVRLHYANL